MTDRSGLAGELKATKMLLDATREQLSQCIGDFVALRDAMPREQVERILGPKTPRCTKHLADECDCP